MPAMAMPADNAPSQGGKVPADLAAQIRKSGVEAIGRHMVAMIAGVSCDSDEGFGKLWLGSGTCQYLHGRVGVEGAGLTHDSSVARRALDPHPGYQQPPFPACFTRGGAGTASTWSTRRPPPSGSQANENSSPHFVEPACTAAREPHRGGARAIAAAIITDKHRSVSAILEARADGGRLPHLPAGSVAFAGGEACRSVQVVVVVQKIEERELVGVVQSWIHRRRVACRGT